MRDLERTGVRLSLIQRSPRARDEQHRSNSTVTPSTFNANKH